MEILGTPIQVWLFWAVLVPLNCFVAGVLIGERRERKGQERAERMAWNRYLRESGFDPDECEQSHLPGDCPLCGGQ